MFLKPTWVASRVDDLPLELLQAHGIKGLAFDLDNTLMPPNCPELWPVVAAFLQRLQQAGLPYCVVSNNKHQAHMKAAEALLGVPVWGHAAKPNTAVLRQAIAAMGLHPSQVLMVGDRPLTDIWVGQRLGCPTLLVEPLTRPHEHAIIHLLRAMERCTVCTPQHPSFLAQP